MRARRRGTVDRGASPRSGAVGALALGLCVALACRGEAEAPPVEAPRALQVSALAIADARGCLIESSGLFGRVYCWSGGEARVGRRVPALEPALAIAVTDREICSLRAGLQVRCLRDLDAPEEARTIKMAPGPYVALASDGECALRADGRVGCRRRRDVEAIEGVIDLGSERSNLFVLQRDGALWSPINGRMTPSGRFPGAVAYRGGCLRFADGAVSCPAGRMGYSGVLRRERGPVALPGPAVAIAVSVSHGCALIEGGEVVCQGSNAWGQLGDGRTGGGPVFTRFELDAPYTTHHTIDGAQQVAVSQSETCVAGTGGVSCWGTPRIEDARPPTEHELTLAARSLVADDDMTCANVGEGTLCWGVRGHDLATDPSGILDAASPRPVLLPHVGLRAVTELGYLFEGGALVPGYLDRRGANGTTAAGGTTFTDERMPPAMVVAGAAGDCVLGEDPTALRCLSMKSYAGTAMLRGDRHFAPLFAGPRITAFTASRRGLRACIVDEDGAVTCATPRRPLAAPWRRSGPPAQGVFGNGAHDCVITRGGGVECWRPDTRDERRGYHVDDPPFALPLADVLEAVASEDEVCGRTREGAVVCAALSREGQPARRWIESGARQVVAGSHHFCALLEGDRVRCHGDDRFGQLGGRPRYVVTEPTPIPLEG